MSTAFTILLTIAILLAFGAIVVSMTKNKPAPPSSGSPPSGGMPPIGGDGSDGQIDNGTGGRDALK